MKKSLLLLGMLASTTVIISADVENKSEVKVISAQELINKVNDLRGKQQYAECIKIIDEALAVTTRGGSHHGLISPLLVTRAQCNYRLQIYEQSIADCDRAIAIDANNSDAYLIKGLALFKLDEADKAIEIIRVAAQKGNALAKDILA
jgi:tetratricopeptide (TPR) repeat protein